MVREFSASTTSNHSRWASRQGASHLPARGHKGPSPAGTPTGVSRGARRAGTRRLRAHCALADCSPHTAEPRVAVATGGGRWLANDCILFGTGAANTAGTLGLIEPGAGNSDEPKEHRRRVAIATCRERNAEIARKSSLATISPNDSRCMTLDVVHATPVPLLWAPHQPRAAEPVRARASGHLAWRLLARFGGDPRPGFAAQCHHRSAQSPVRAYARRVVRSAAAAG